MEKHSHLSRYDLSKYTSQHKIKNTLTQATDLEHVKRSKNKDKKDLATTGQVFDKKTYKILQKFRVNSIFDRLGECISQGKEALVFHACDMNEPDKLFAVKIYKTMVLDFKDREEYISGEFRFRFRGKGQRTNPHKLIKDWAEKEFRNYKRLETEKIRCPKALYLKHNVLVMELLGSPNNVAKRLRDVKLPLEKISHIYIEVVKVMRTMFTKAKLVHGDLSEFNLLYHDDLLYVIDVSQSVEDNHPMAIEFLKRDIYNINEYFKKLGVTVFRLRDLFRFITDSSLKGEEEEEEQVSKMIDTVRELDEDYIDQDAELFMGINIPRSLHELDLYTIEKHIYGEGEVKEQLYSNLVGLNQLKQREQSDTSSGEEESSDDDEIMTDIAKDKKEKKKREEDERTPEQIAEEKRLRKKMVKEENRERRKTKVPKKVKKKMEKIRKNAKKK